MTTALLRLAVALSPSARWLAIAVVIDLAVGDPVYAWHPVRIIGQYLTWLETRLRALGLDGYGGGILLFVKLAGTAVLATAALMMAAGAVSPLLAAVVHVFFLYSLLALGDLLHHVWRIERAVRRGALPAARQAVSALVGRDTDRMDAAACRRAAVESLSENLADGFVSPLFWYVLGGLPGLIVFKVVSTMDSMVGYKTPRYLRFGWCGARLDDAMNFLPARFTWILLSVIALVAPQFSGRKAWTVGLRQHRRLLGPNSGWSEAATAGALERRIVGPIWLKGALVTEIWIGDPGDPPLQTSTDVTRALVLVSACGVVASALACAVLWRWHWIETMRRLW